MIISDSKKFVFVHIPKTAGTSIEHSLQQYSTPLKKFATSSIKKKIVRNRHSGACALQQVLGEQWDKYFKFAFVRNPWDLMLSHYFYFRTSAGKSIRHINTRKMGFNEYIRWDFNLPIEQSGFIIGFSYFLDINNVIALDYVGKFETLENDFRLVQRRINIPIKHLPVTNKTKHNNYKTYYNGKSKRIVKKAFEKYIDYFNYTF